MAKLNMALGNTLFRKGYLLTGVVIAANMFVVNEVKASKNENDKIEMNINKKPIDEFFTGPCKYIGFLLQWENTINLVGGALFTFANRLYKFYENKPSFYFDYWFVGWNSKPFAKGYLQFCPNINLGRGIFWLVMACTQDKLLDPRYKKLDKALIEKLGKDKEQSGRHLISKYLLQFYARTASLVGMKITEDPNKINRNVFFLKLLQDLVSIPLILNLAPRFSISIALDSIMWIVVTRFIDNGTKQKQINKAKEEINTILSDRWKAEEDDDNNSHDSILTKKK